MLSQTRARDWYPDTNWKSSCMSNWVMVPLLPPLAQVLSSQNTLSETLELTVLQSQPLLKQAHCHHVPCFGFCSCCLRLGIAALGVPHPATGASQLSRWNTRRFSGILPYRHSHAYDSWWNVEFVAGEDNGVPRALSTKNILTWGSKVFFTKSSSGGGHCLPSSSTEL